MFLMLIFNFGSYLFIYKYKLNTFIVKILIIKLQLRFITNQIFNMIINPH